MNIQEIQVSISPNGKVAIALKGVKGDQCLTLTKEIEMLLGNEIEDRKMNHEFYELPAEGSQQQIQKRKK